ncbi:MAG TPA: hypothetical protein VG898_03460 [Solirubrobacterales bacterium]|nr:hypothetical protein [Solirubrobacterales bacterium]
MLPLEAPEWEPLLDLAEAHVEDFMWMYAVELEDGSRVQAYKHRWTRNYLFLDGDSRAYVYLGDQRYEEEEKEWLFARAVREDLAHRDWYGFVGHNEWEPDRIEISWTRSATKHRISRERSAHVVRTCALRFAWRSHDGPLSFEDSRIMFLGDDNEGIGLEVVALEVGDEAFRVIHAMEVRRKHVGLYWRAKRWQR